MRRRQDILFDCVLALKYATLCQNSAAFVFFSGPLWALQTSLFWFLFGLFKRLCSGGLPDFASGSRAADLLGYGQQVLPAGVSERELPAVPGSLKPSSALGLKPP